MADIIRDGKDYDEFEFLSNYLHDIRAGLTVIGGYSSLLIEGDVGALSEEQKECVVAVKKSYEDMINLTNNATSIVRIQYNQWKINRQDLNLKNLIVQVVKKMEPQITEKNLKIDFKSDDENPVIRGDSEALSQAIYFLLLNSIDFSPLGSSLQINIIKKEISWQVFIQDNGAGIPLEEIPKLFQPFYKSSILELANRQDQCLGLLIAKKLIELHNGRVWLESQIGRGSKINFELAAKKEIGKLKILIVEDNLVIAKMWANKLKKEFLVDIASTGKEGIDKANADKPDLILLDVLMPGMDGFEVCRQLKMQSEFRDLPVIFLSNLVQDNLLDKVKGLGAVDFIAKSNISPSSLEEKIKQVLEKKLGEISPD